MTGAGLRVMARLERLGPLYFAMLLALLLASAVWLIGGLATSWWLHPPGLVNAGGAAIGRDFVSPYAAATMALAGDPAAPYDLVRLHAIERQVIGAPIPPTPWLYPPIFLLLIVPLALLPYLAALACWLAAQLLFGMRLIARLGPHPLASVALLAFPATAQSLISGQNGILSCLLLAGGLSELDRRPWRAGLFFGLLSYKPQIAAAAFAALLFGRCWRALAAAAATVAVLAAMSTLIFGLQPWIGFLEQMGFARALLESGDIAWDRLVTVFAAAKLIGASNALAWFLQSAVSLSTLGALAYVWHRQMPLAWRGATLAVAVPLLTPYAFHYDLVVLLLPLAWLAYEGQISGFRRGETALLAAAWASPVAGWLLARSTHVLVTPLIIVLLLLAVLHRAWQSKRSSHSELCAPLATTAH